MQRQTYVMLRASMLLLSALACIATIIAVAAATSQTDAGPEILTIKQPGAPAEAESILEYERVAVDVPATTLWQAQATRAFRSSSTQLRPSDLPVAPRLALLRSEARGGRADAALQLFLDLERCAGHSAALDRVEAGLDAALSTASDAAQQLAISAAEDGVAAAATWDALCADVTAADLAERDHWLELAARQGDAAAANLFATRGTAATADSIAMFRDPAAVAQYKARATQYVMQAARRCDVDAIAFLSDGYSSGLWFPRDETLGHALRLVSERLTPGIEPQPSPDLSADHEVIAANIYQRYCR